MNDKQSNCRAELVQRDDGSWWCPECGLEAGVVTAPQKSLRQQLAAAETKLAAVREKCRHQIDSGSRIQGLARELLKLIDQ